jgi:hypothetical protein
MIRRIKATGMIRGHTPCMEETQNTYKILDKKPERGSLCNLDTYDRIK